MSSCKHHFRKKVLAFLERLVTAIESLAGLPRGPRLFISTLVVEGFTFVGELMSFQLSDVKTASASFSAVDAKGNPAAVENPTWASSDEAIFTVSVSVDGMTATVIPTGPLGTAQLQFSADADLGAGVVPIGGLADVEIVASQAVSAVISLVEN